MWFIDNSNNLYETYIEFVRKINNMEFLWKKETKVTYDWSIRETERLHNLLLDKNVKLYEGEKLYSKSLDNLRNVYYNSISEVTDKDRTKIFKLCEKAFNQYNTKINKRISKLFDGRWINSGYVGEFNNIEYDFKFYCAKLLTNCYPMIIRTIDEEKRLCFDRSEYHNIVRNLRDEYIELLDISMREVVNY